MSLEKYAVVVEPDATKTASTKEHCPKCGRELPLDIIYYCNYCGTEPWAKKSEPSS